MSGVAAVTVKPLFKVTTSAPLVTVMLVAPSAAAAVIDTGTVRLVAVAAVGALAVTAPLANVTTDVLLKCVKLPVIVTGTFVAPCWPVFGLTWLITGVPADTVKPLFSVTTSAPLVTVTLVAPSAAAAVIDTGTVRLVAVAAVGAPAVTAPLAKVTTDVLLKCVKLPVIVTGTFVAPCWPVFGLTWLITGVPADTVKPLFSVTTSAPLVTVTLVAPSAAAAVIDTGTVRLVAVAAVGAPAVTAPLAKVTTDVLLKCVKLPVIVTGTFVAPCWPEFGLTCVITGVPAFTVKPLFRVTTSAPVVTVTLVAPNAAAAVIDTGTVRLVAVAAVGAPAVTAPLANVTTDVLLKCVKLPVIVTGTFVAPCCPVFGFTWLITGVPADTVKPLFSVTTSAPLVTVTFVAPNAAACVIDTGTVRLVAVAAVGAPAVTAPLANVTTEVLLKCVKLPVIVTGTFVAPCCPVFGFTWLITGVPADTVKPLFSVTTSAPLVTVTFVAPNAAACVIDTGTVRLVAVAAVGAPAVTAPLAKVTTDVLLKCVKLPVIVTGTFVAPC